MPTEFKNRVFGCAIIKAINSNYNADFTHQPRTLPNGVVYATDKALKYLIKNYLLKNFSNEKIFYFKSYNENMNPLSLDERYKFMFDEYPKVVKETNEYSIFYYNGEEIIGRINQKPNATKMKNYFNKLENDNAKKDFQSILNKWSKKNECKLTTTNSIGKNDKVFGDEEFFFYINGNNQIIKLEGEFETLKELINDLDYLLTGGIDKHAVLKNLLKCLDVKLFGATFAGATNISIHGTVQINHGVNRFPENSIYSEQIMSPFRNPGEAGSEEKAMTTLGTQSKLKEGHYVHHFSVNPKNMDDHFTRVGDKTIMLSTEDIDKLKEAIRRGATYYDSASKAGTENELLVWVQLKPESKLILPNFTELIVVTRDEDAVKIDMKRLTDELSKDNVKSEIEKIEIYYNNTNTEILNSPSNISKSEL
ncbi:MAG: type I CRISPR-associated protein Cas7 [Bacteroidota bacterium]|nr:type I CRISPR-associated protein Cas7 [Bacteroidota bacterium]